MLYDAYGRPVKGLKRTEMTRRAAAVLVRDKWQTYPADGLTPRRLASILKEADAGDILRQMELFTQMEAKDAHLSAVLQTRKNAVTSLDYRITPGEESTQGRKIAEDVEESLGALPLSVIFLDLLDAIGKGFALAEIVYENNGGRLAIGEVAWVPQTKVTFAEYQADPYAASKALPRLLTKEEPIHGVELPPFKFIYHRYRARSGYDTGAGVLRVCAWMYLFKNYTIKDWVAFAEVYGMPLRLGKYEPGASPEDKDALMTAVQSLGSDAAGVISKSTEIEFVEAVRNASSDLYKTLVDFANAEMSKAILGQTLTTQEGQHSGSYALGKVHEQVRFDLIEADAAALARTLTRQLIRPYVGLNYGWDAPVPTFSFEIEKPEDLKATAETYKILADMGYPLTVEHLSERFNVPIPEKGQAILGPSTGDRLAPCTGDRPVAPTYAGAFSSGRPSTVLVPGTKTYANAGSRGRPSSVLVPGFTPDQAAIEGLIETATKESMAGDGFTKTLREIIAAATSYEDLQQRIAEQWPELTLSQFQTVLDRALFEAELYGREQVFKSE